MATARQRDSARVLVLDPTACVLLVKVVDWEGTADGVWIAPGGGIEPGESLREAAVRELAEETGLRVDERALVGPVAATRGEWVLHGERLRSVDTFFALRTDRYEPVDTGLTALEVTVHRGWRWWTTAELEATTASVLPGGPVRLATLVTRVAALGPAAGDDPVEVPWLVP